MVVEPLTSNTSSTPNLSIALLVRAGVDFAVAGPSNYVRDFYYATAGVMSEPGFNVKVHQFEGLQHDTRTIYGVAGGELFTSLRQLIGRREFYYNYLGVGTATAKGFQTFIAALPDPVSLPSPTLTGTTAYYAPTLLGVIMGLFAHWRGTLRYVVVPQVNPLAGSWQTGTIMISRTQRGALGVAGPVFVDSGAVIQSSTGLAGPWGTQFEGCGSGSEAVMSTDIDGPSVAVAASVPFTAGTASGFNVVAPCLARNAARTLSSGANVVFDGCWSEDAKLAFKAYMSAGDDFAAYGWTGMPPLNQRPPFTYTTQSW